MAAKSKTAAQKNISRAQKPQVQHSAAPVIEPSVKQDILAVLLIVLAVAMVVALVTPTSAVVTTLLGRALALLFGVGAILCPVAIVLFAATHFMDRSILGSKRVAIGLGLIVLAVLALISVNAGVPESMPQLVLDPAYMEKAGGLVGGALAWVLLVLVGRIVANVMLSGLIVTGALVCGLSLSKLKSGMQGKMEALKQSREAARAQKAEPAPAVADLDELFADVQDPDGTAPTTLFDPVGDGKTTYIGDRKTTVLKRGRKKAAIETEAAAPEETSGSKAEKTTKKRHPRLSLKHVQPAADVDDASDSANETPDEDEPEETAAAPAAAAAAPAHEAVPDFLKEAAARAEGKGRATKTAAPAAAPAASTASGADGAELPPLSLLESNPDSAQSMSSQEELRTTAEKLQSTLEEFGLTAKVTGWVSGPIVTTFQISMGEGERVSRITNLEDDIALSLAATSVRIFAPIPGTSLVGIEIPNHERQSVCLGDVLPYAKSKSPLEVAFGRDTEGKPITVDIAKLPHLLVAGTTGSGKSVLLNTIIVSMLMRATPQQVRMIMIDPKRVEFTGYNGLPHLYVPVVTDPHQAAGALQWGVSEMERRLKVFEHYKVRDIKTFNANIDGDKWADMEHPPEHMPYFVIVIDELSDLMMVARKDVEASIVRIAQLGRAAGIHLIVATQRPSADVVTGLIKANIDNRVALSVDSSVNSRIILDATGAERLLGSGDMLYRLRGRKPKRALGCYVSDDEIESVVSFVKEHFESDMHSEILSAVAPGALPGESGSSQGPEDDDPLVWEAAQIVVDSQLGSTSGLQRRLKVGYARAGRIMDMLEAKGIVGPPDGSKPREVLLDEAGLEELRIAEEKYREVV